jgi:hypothetical protein
MYWFLGPYAQDLKRYVLYEIYALWSWTSNIICTEMDKDKVLNGQQVIEEAMSTLPPPRVIVVSLIGVDGCCVDEGLERMLGRSSI